MLPEGREPPTAVSQSENLFGLIGPAASVEADQPRHGREDPKMPPVFDKIVLAVNGSEHSDRAAQAARAAVKAR